MAYKAWTSNAQGTTTFRAVAYGSGYWVAVGDSGALYYKQGAASGAWTSNTQGSTTFRGVAYGNGYWTAVGDSGVLYYKQGDPSGSWTSNTQGSDQILAAAYAGGNWACVGARYIRYHATDPSGTWSTGLDLGDSTSQNTMRGICHNGSRWVAVGGAYAAGSGLQVRTSTDLTTWNDRSGAYQDESNCVAAGDLYGTTQTVFGINSLSGGTNGGFSFGTDSEVEASTFHGYSGGHGEVPWAVCYGAGWFVRVGNNGFLRATTQLIAADNSFVMGLWNASGTEDWGGSGTAQGSAHLYGVAYAAVSGTHTWVAVGASGALIYTTDYPVGPSCVYASFNTQVVGTPLTISGNSSTQYIGSTEYLVVEYHPGNTVACSESSWIKIDSGQEIAAQTGVQVFWRRVTAAVVSAGFGTVTQTAADHLMCSRVTIIDDEGDDPLPYSVSTFSQEAVSDTSVSIPGVTTSQADELVMAVVTTGFDPGSNLDGISGSWANANLTRVEKAVDWWHTQGNGGGHSIVLGRLATASDAGATTATLVNAAQKCHHKHAHKPKKKPIPISDQAETLLVATSPQRW